MIKIGRDIGWKEFFKKLYHEWDKDNLSDIAAALTYYGVLALFPFLLFLVALVGLVLTPSALGEMVRELSRVAPGDVVKILEERLRSLTQNESGGVAIFGILAAYWAASNAISSLARALNRGYDVTETRPFWKVRGMALLVTLGTGVFSVLAIAILLGVPLVGRFIGGPLGALVTWLRLPIAGLIVMVLWAFLYYILPNVRPKFQVVSAGSVIGVLLWLVASWGFSEYVRRFGSYESTYGTLGGVIVLLIWMYVSSQVLLIGAEINKILTPQEKLKESAAGERRLERQGVPPARTPIPSS